MTAPLPDRPPIGPREFAASTLALLAEDPRRYRAFGQYWYFVKALLKMFYDQHNLYMLGDYVDPSVVERMPKMGAMDTLQAAAEEYRQNASFRLLSNEVEDDDGETFTLIDPDAEGAS
jgi:hypothetical protein